MEHMLNCKIKNERLILTKSNKIKGKTHRFVREQYLRFDIPCRSELCQKCNNKLQNDKQGILPKDVTHYVVPCTDIAGNYVEIFEFNEFTGIIFLQSVIAKVLFDMGRRFYNKIYKKIRDPSAKSIFFPNEFNFYTFLQRQNGESYDDWHTRNIYNTSLWYFNHLEEQIPVMMLTENLETIQKYNVQTLGVHVISLQEYLSSFWPHLTFVHDIFYSLNASLKELTHSNDADYVDYLCNEILLAGIKAGRYYQGVLNVNKHNSMNEATISNTGTFSKIQDILIPGMKLRNRAMHGDVVVVELLPKNKWQGRTKCLNEESEDTVLVEHKNPLDDVMPTGRIVGVLQRGWRDYAASFPQEQEDNCQRKAGDTILVIPYDYRIPKIRIVTRHANNLKDDRVVVRIDSWNKDSQYPNGHFVRSLGKIGDLETEIATLLVEYEVIHHEFSDKILAEMPMTPWETELEEIERRLDLRETHLIFSIDPLGCEDVDDCLSVRDLPNGNIELGVHIADVTHFVKPESLTDSEAKRRSTTVYLADRRFDMLPRVLNSDLCSLLSGVNRYAVSVMWELSPTYSVNNVRFGRTIICSSYKLFYEVAQEILNGASLDDLKDKISEFNGLDEEAIQIRFSDLKKALHKLSEIGNFLKFQRLQAGALELKSNEIEVEVTNSDVRIENIKPKEELEIHEVVAECMIFANHWVAKKIFESFPHQSILRRHPPPRETYFQDLLLCAESKGFIFDLKSNKTLAESLDQSIDNEDPNVNFLMRMLATQAMSVAEYFSTGSLPEDAFSHYGLGLDHYTHFTSPIRRYSDILVHRLLICALNPDTDSSYILGNSDLQELCQHINSKHKASQKIQKTSQQLFQTLYFKDKEANDECCITDAIIFSLRTNGVLAYIPRYGIKGPVYLRNKENQVAYVLSGKAEWIDGKLIQEKYALSVETIHGLQRYKLFDHITVQIQLIVSRIHLQSLRLNLINNQPCISNVEECLSSQHKRCTKPVNFLKEIQDRRQVENDKQMDVSPSHKKTEISFYLVLEHLHLLSLQVPDENDES